MPQKKKKTNKKSHKKKHINQNNKTIIYQSIPNYSSTQSGGHQINKNVSFGPPQQQETRTDNLVGDLVGKLISKIETDKTQQTQDYSKEIQPINNNNNVNIYNNSPGTTTTTIDKKTDETPSQTPDSKPESKISDAISNSVKGAARSAGEDFALQAGAGLASIATAALGTAGIRNRKAIRNSISNFPSNARNSLGSIRERFRGSSAYRPQVDVPDVSAAVSRRPSNASNQAASVAASSRRPSNASSAENNIIDPFFSAVGISPERSARAPTASSAQRGSAARPRSNSTSSVFYGEGGGTNLMEQFNNLTPARTPARRAPVLNTEQRGHLERTLRNQKIDPSNISPIRQDILRGRQSGIQQRDIGASTRTIRAQTGEAHTQLQTPARRGRGRPQTNEYARPIGPVRLVGRPQTNEYPRPIGPARPRGRPAAAQAEEAPQAQRRTPARAARQPVTRKVGDKK